MRKTIALLGVGLMGAQYARHLVEDGHRVRLYNRTRSKAEAIMGAAVFDAPEQASRGADVLISILANDAVALEQVSEKTLQAMAEGGVHLSCSTLSVETTLELVKRAKAAGRDHLSAPFLGRPEIVAQRAHQFLFSGESARREEMVAFLKTTSKAVVDFGDRPEAAVITKLSTNFLIASAITSMSESFALLEKAGISTRKAFELWTSSLFDCPMYKAYGKKVMEAQHDKPSFVLELALKDVNLVRQASEELGASHDLMTAVRDRFAQSVEAGHGAIDFTGVSKLIREQSGL